MPSSVGHWLSTAPTCYSLALLPRAVQRSEIASMEFGESSPAKTSKSQLLEVCGSIQQRKYQMDVGRVSTVSVKIRFLMEISDMAVFYIIIDVGLK